VKYLVKNRWLLLYLTWVDRLLIKKEKEMRVPPKRVLLSNIAHLGDVVIASCAISIIKKAYPKADIGFLTSSSSKVVLKGHKDLKYLHTFDHFKHNRGKIGFLKKFWRHVASLYKACISIRQVQYDLAVDLYPFYPNSIALLMFCHIPYRLGFTSGGYGPSLTHPVPFDLKEGTPMSRYYKTLFAKIGVEVTSYKPSLVSSNRQFPSYILFHPGAGNPLKEWDIESWKRVYRRSCVFTGFGEREAKIIQAIDKEALSFCGILDFPDLVSLVSKASLVVCVDTCIQHIAAAFDIPTITIYIERDKSGLFHGDSPQNIALFPLEDREAAEELIRIRVKQLFI
jgi:ADP-heptose:LPS heptosyltransferase